MLAKALFPSLCIKIDDEDNADHDFQGGVHTETNMTSLRIPGISTAVGWYMSICIDFRCLTLRGGKTSNKDSTNIFKKLGMWWDVSGGLMICWKAWSWPYGQQWEIKGFLKVSAGKTWCIGIPYFPAMLYIDIGGAIFLFGGSAIGKTCGSCNGRPWDYEGWDKKYGAHGIYYACGFFGLEISLSLSGGFSWRGGGGWRRRRKCDCDNVKSCTKIGATLTLTLSMTFKPLAHKKNTYFGMGLTLQLQVQLAFGVRVSLPSWHWSPLFPPILC